FQHFRRSVADAGDTDLNVCSLFQATDFLALLVEQVVGHVLGDADLDGVDAFAVGGELDHAHDIDAHAFSRLDLAAADAMRAVLVDAALERRADALARHLDDAEGRDFENLGAGSVALDGFAHRSLDAAAVFLLAHVDKVVDNHAP